MPRAIFLPPTSIVAPSSFAACELAFQTSPDAAGHTVKRVAIQPNATVLQLDNQHRAVATLTPRTACRRVPTPCTPSSSGLQRSSDGLGQSEPERRQMIDRSPLNLPASIRDVKRRTNYARFRSRIISLTAVAVQAIRGQRQTIAGRSRTRWSTRR